MTISAAERSARAWALAVAVLLALAPAASAAPGMEIGMEDERLLLSHPEHAEEAVADWAALGVDTVRLHARWYAVAPGLHRTRKPRGFHASDPGDRRYDWKALDRAVELVLEAGMRPILSITGPAPWWATRHPRLRRPQYMPRAPAFAQFARAVALRYGERVDRYMIWNEPNQPGWLAPQNACAWQGVPGRRRRVCAPVAPHLYRDLLAAALPEIREHDPGAQVLFGELAPVGERPRTTRTPVAPLPFLRALACVDRSYRPLRGGPCTGFRAPAADALGYHPHGRLRPPDKPNPDRDEAQIGDLRRLLTVLDKLTARGRLRAPAATRRRFDVHLTEFGFQTSPPDEGVGVELWQQTRYMQQAAYIAWSSPRVRSLTHYQWEDEAVVERRPGTFGGWQSGLRFHDGRAKPALSVFESPFVLDADRGLLWGQVRPGTGHAVTVEVRRAGAAEFVPLIELATDEQGFWRTPLEPERDADYRFSWLEPPGRGEDAPRRRHSGIVDVDSTARAMRAAEARGVGR